MKYSRHSTHTVNKMRLCHEFHQGIREGEELPDITNPILIYLGSSSHQPCCTGVGLCSNEGCDHIPW